MKIIEYLAIHKSNVSIVASLFESYIVWFKFVSLFNAWKQKKSFQ